MKCRSSRIRYVLPAILLSISGNIFPSSHDNGSRHDTLATSPVYMKHTFKTIRRNAALRLVPTMYTLAKGDREHTEELWGTVSVDSTGTTQFNISKAVATNGKRKGAMSIAIHYAMPNIYAVKMFDGRILSPFHTGNRQFYQYTTEIISDSTYLLVFRPKISNTQLASGWAVAYTQNKRIWHCRIRGEHDMISYDMYVNMGMGTNVGKQPLPISSRAELRFSFLGNRIESNLTCRQDKSSTTNSQTSETNSQNCDTNSKGKNSNPILEVLEDNLLGSIKLHSGKAQMRISPLIDPLKISYSSSRGLSYRMKFDARYNLNGNSFLTLKPRLGYNFKIKKVYYSAPLRYTIDNKRRTWVELLWANGNRITDASVINTLKDMSLDSVDFKSMQLDYFDDQQLKFTANTSLGSKVQMAMAAAYHRREAVNKHFLDSIGKPTEYNSFAPSLTLTYCHGNGWPTLSATYERGIKGVALSNIGYGRMELDAFYSKNMKRFRKISLRLGGGMYTDRSEDYFVDYDNFKDNSYLPDDWDDWTGNFQLLSSDWYNASDYYLRMNASYESPFIIASRLPWIGRLVETERLYIGMVRLKNTRPYSEVGYGFTNRYVSLGLFASFLNASFQEAGCKFTLELFRRW